MHRTLLSAVLSLSVLLSPLVAAQDASYTFTPIDVPGAVNTLAHGINNNGQIVGSFGDATGSHSFLKDGATFSTIDAPGAVNTQAYGINGVGQIAGHFYEISGRVHGFVTDGVTFTRIDVPDATDTFVYRINDNGQIVGQFFDGIRFHSFLKDATTFTRIEVPGATGTQAFDINNSGQIVGFFNDATGTHGFLKDGTTFTRIDAPGAEPVNGLLNTATYGINNNGQIVGSFYNFTGWHNFVTDGTTYTPLEVPGATQSTPWGINDSRQIVGQFIDAAGGFHGYLATVDTTPPVITVSVSPATLSPPNGRLVPVTASGTITDEPGGSGVQTSTYQVIDEYGQIQPSGSMTLVNGRYSFTVALEASRRGNDQDGRRYTIVVSARDNARNLGRALATVTVPHN